MEYDLTILNGKIVTPQKILDGLDIAVHEGRVAAVDRRGSFAAARETIDADGKHILPGIIDVHVHFREPGAEYKEDFNSGTAAAAGGGVTMVLDMPNNRPVCATVAALKQKLNLIAPKAITDYGLMAAVTGDNIAQIPALAEAGANGFKIFMGVTTGGVPAPDDGEMLNALSLIRETGLRVAVHAENNSIIEYFSRKLKKEGRVDPRAHVAARPAIAEAEAVQRAILFAGETGCKLHICHLSSKQGVEIVRFARKRGLDITAEATPHHLLLDDMHMDEVGGIQKVNPPVRSREHTEAIWEGLHDGTIENIATDHAPHIEQEKKRGSIWDIHSGFPGVETSVPLMLSQVNKGRLSLNAYVKLAAENPARTFGLYPRKGVIAAGSDADFTIVDMGRISAIDSRKLHSRSTTTPFDGWPVKGIPVYTIVRGQVVMKEGQITGRVEGRHIRACNMTPARQSG